MRVNVHDTYWGKGNPPEDMKKGQTLKDYYRRTQKFLSQPNEPLKSGLKTPNQSNEQLNLQSRWISNQTISRVGFFLSRLSKC